MANSLQTSGLNQLKGVLANETMKKNFENILKESAAPFMASIIELYQSDSYLQKCNPNAVVLEALKAATLKLPINRGLGFGFIVPYKDVPQFLIGYRGLIQLAQRSGQYKYINADVVYEGEKINYNRISGMLEISGEATSENVIGYFAFFELLNGFQKSVFWSREKVLAHAKKFSRAYQYDLAKGAKASPWSTNFDAMALKTVLRSIISKYGPMSVEFANAMANDNADRVEAEVAENANKSAVVIPAEEVEAQQKEAAQATAEAVETPFPMEGEPQYDPDEEPGF